MKAQEGYDRLVGELAGQGVTPGQMFGKPTLKLGTKAIACLQSGGMAFKLGAGSAVHADALGLDGAALFDPAGMGRGMKDWVWVPAAHAARWSELADAARQFVGG